MHRRSRAGLVFALLLLAVRLGGATATGPYRRTVSQIMDAGPGWSPTMAPPIHAVLRAPRRHLPSNPASPRAAAAPAAGTRSALPASLNAGTSFLGAALSDANAFPPDSMGAAGPTQFLVGVNGRIRSFSKATGAADGVLDATLDAFFETVRNGDPTGTPRVRYDRLSSRWFVTASNFPLINNRVLIAVSDAASSGVISNATVWTYYYFLHNLDAPAGDTDLFLDSASLGVDANALVIGGNVFDASGVFQGVTVHVAQKSELLTGSGGNLTVGGLARAFRNLTGTPTGEGPYSPQGVDDLFDAGSLESWVVGVDNAGFGALVFRKITYSAPDTWPPASISANLPLTVPATAIPLTVPHAGNVFGTDGELDAVDDRLTGASLRGGTVWTAHNISVDASGAAPGDRDGSRWYQIDVSSGTPVLLQSGTLFDPAVTDPRFYWIPAIAVSGQGHAAIGASAAGAVEHVNAAAAMRLSDDPPGTLQAPALLTAATDAYNPAGDPGPAWRWGDYSFTSVDPDDDMTMWTIQEYCNAEDSWGVRVVQLLAPPPAMPSAAVPPAVVNGQASVLVDVTGTALLGSGFFDPGPGFARHIQASVTGGATVNSVTYTSPTSITLDLDTTLAAPGPQSITVTNPDGQAAEGMGILTITSDGSPFVASIAPTSGPAGGGTSAVVGGVDFATGATVTIGGAAAPLVMVTSGTTADITVPALPPGTLNDVTLTNPDTLDGTLANGWFADFLDVDQNDIFHDDVEKLVRNAVTVGCGAGNYCRNASVTRGQMAVFLLKSKLGAGYAPPACSGTVFLDVDCSGPFDSWIEDIASRGITGGCGGGNYCPDSPVTRAQMSAFLLKTDLGEAYVPPACSGTVFLDVDCGGLFDSWIEDLASREITGGCGGGNYCPDSPVTRGQMSALLVKTFALP